MNSSSESIPSVVSGVGGAASAAAAEAAILLLDLVACLSEDGIASAAFLFLGWEEMVSTVGVLMLNSSGETRSWSVRLEVCVTIQVTQESYDDCRICRQCNRAKELNLQEWVAKSVVLSRRKGDCMCFEGGS